MRKNSIKKKIAFVGLSFVMCLNMSSIVFAEEQTSKFEVSPALEDVTNALESYYDEEEFDSVKFVLQKSDTIDNSTTIFYKKGEPVPKIQSDGKIDLNGCMGNSLLIKNDEPLFLENGIWREDGEGGVAIYQKLSECVHGIDETTTLEDLEAVLDIAYVAHRDGVSFCMRKKGTNALWSEIGSYRDSLEGDEWTRDYGAAKDVNNMEVKSILAKDNFVKLDYYTFGKMMHNELREYFKNKIVNGDVFVTSWSCYGDSPVPFRIFD